MAQRIVWLVGAVALALLLWFFLRSPEARGGALPERDAAPAQGRPSAELAPAASTPLADASSPVRETPLTREAAPASTASALPSAHRLRVRVVDESGAPRAALGVRLELRSPARDSTSVHRAATLEDGFATFDALEHDPLLAADDLTLRAQLDGLFVPAIEARAPGVPWPSQPLELVVPAHGSVLVSVLDEHGGLLSGGSGDVVLRLVRELEAGAKIWREDATLTASLTEGTARFALVAPGLRLQAAYDDRPRHPPARVEFAGPERTGEEVRVELRLVPPAGELSLRVLSPERVPLASAALEATFTRKVGGGSFATGETRRTDPEGRLVVPIGDPWSEGETRSLTLLHQPADGPECSATLDLSRELPPAQRDLGDVVLAARSVLVSGRVIDTQGAGVADVSVTVERSWDETPEGEIFWGSGAWADVREDGSFVFYDELPEPLRLTFDSAEYEPVEPIRFTPGTRGLEIVVRRGVALRGNVLLPEGLDPAGITVAAVGAAELARRSVGLEPARTFALTGLAPGAYDVEFSLQPTEERLLTVPAVVAREGHGPDPRLVDVDLTKYARVVRLGVLSSDGAPAAGGWVRVLGERVQEVAFVIEAGQAELLVPATGSDVEVNVPGHRTLLIHGLTADREVRLEPAFRVRFELASDVELSESGSLQLRLGRADSGGRTSWNYVLYRGHQQAGWFNTAFGGDANTFTPERRALELEVPAPGDYDLLFFLVRGDPDGGRISLGLSASGPNARLTLDESSAGLLFVVEPDAAEYAELLRAR